MKKTSYFTQSFLTVTFVATVLLFASCNNSQRPRDTKEVAEERNDENFNNTQQEKDAQFLVNAAEINLKQIQLGQLAQQKGSSTHVKELGKMMEDAHTKSQRDLTALARSKSITIPTTPTDDVKDAYKDLNEKSGKDFDKAYSDLMVKRHKDAIDDFENAATDSNDREVKNWATASLPDMRAHLDHSIESQKKNEELASK
jgi:putative membrane protein